MKTYTHLTIQTLADGTVRLYGNGGMIFETRGENLRVESSIYQKDRPNSGEVVVKKNARTNEEKKNRFSGIISLSTNEGNHEETSGARPSSMHLIERVGSHI